MVWTGLFDGLDTEVLAGLTELMPFIATFVAAGIVLRLFITAPKRAMR